MALKHVGRIKNTGRRCVIVFREIYDEKGNVVDDKNCLVFESESLPDAEHQDLMRIIESEPAQSTGDLYNVLARERLGTGTIALNWLAQTGRLRKFPTSNIELVPDSNSIIGLDTLNKIVKMQNSGVSQEEIEQAIRDDTDNPPRDVTNQITSESTATPSESTEAPATPQSGDDGVLDDAAIAKNYVEQAEMFEMQAKELRDQAYEMDPSLKPKRTKRTPPKKKEPANDKA